MREQIISTVSRTGGHLGASLGVVELTVALHTCFDSPRDKIVWDVGHQAYVHKLLTGRLDRFDTLRRKGGLSGFPKRSESEHDMFGVGHASTAVSAALGYAAARDARGEDHKVVAVVGDGALTGGLAFEGLNNAGQANTDLLVILNDNKMSISPNVGGIARYLTLITSDEFYNRFEGEVWKLLGIMPKGDKAQILAGRVKEGLKNLVVPTILFEELGFKYFGPIDGHDLGLLRRTLAHVSKLKGPIFVHVVTEKGKGYRFAEQDDQRYHGVGAFDKAEGIKAKQAAVPSWTKVFGDHPHRAGGRGRAHPRHHRGHALGHGHVGPARAPPRALPRRGHRRGARRDLRRRPGLPRPAPGLRHLFHVPAAGPRPDHPRRGAAEAARGLRRRPGRRRR